MSNIHGGRGRGRGTGTGGHSGSESGWTMYIGSHISGAENHTDDYGQQHYCYGNSNSHHYQRGVEAESDDSMASDASSGPSHQELPCVSGTGEGRRRTNSFKHTNDDESYSGRKSEKQGKHRDETRVKKPDKEKPSAHSHKVNSAASYVRTKARKNKYK